MNKPHDPDVTADIPADSLDAGLAAGFGRPVAPPSSLGDLRPVLLREAEGESDHVVKPNSDAMPPTERRPATAISRPARSPAAAWGRCCAAATWTSAATWPSRCCWRSTPIGPTVARRFIEEAQIGGQLQHPGVVPVYDIGRFGDRPFFTMKLVKGQTLAALLSERSDPAADRPRLLSIALQVTQALAYAHAKGVIHRDLKPANVMVGAFGEVQVMDWGLAKVLAEGGVADEERASRQHQPEEGTADPHRPQQRHSGQPRQRHRGRIAAGHAGVHAAGAGQRRRCQSRPPRRRVRPGGHPVRGPDGQAALRGPLRRGGAPQGRQRRPGGRHGAAGRLRRGRGVDCPDEGVFVARSDRPAQRTRRPWRTR